MLDYEVLNMNNSMTVRRDELSTHSSATQSFTTPRTTQSTERSYSSSSQKLPSKVSPTPPRQKSQQNSKPSQDLEVLQATCKKLQTKVLGLQHKLILAEEREARDQKKIQALELVLQREAQSTPSFSYSSPLANGARVAESKYLAQIDALSSKLYKLEERNQALVEEAASLKSDLRNKKKDYEGKVKDLQAKHEFELRNLGQQQREFASGLRKETRKDVDGLKQHLVVQETDLQKKHTREVLDLKAGQLERELQLKDTIRRLQDELEYMKQTAKRASIRPSGVVYEDNKDEDDEETKRDGKDDDSETTNAEEEGDPGECY